MKNLTHSTKPKKMTHRDFCNWLLGFIDGKSTLYSSDIIKIKENLDKVSDTNNPIFDTFRDRLRNGQDMNIKVAPLPNAPRIICEKDDKETDSLL